ncbi:polyprenyl synthetase family protein [Paenibacillus yanchengensis]|uniref:Polyprenyl synthetase family protein n=1 Tax=Paenibacillus yanchengensis TaxID=2035833 RepID=A0ABW4YN91_9BACL
MMSEPFLIDDVKSYRNAEQEAAQYFTTLHSLLENNTYMEQLVVDFKQWEKDNRRQQSWYYRWFKLDYRNVPGVSSNHYLHTLEKQGKLDDYLERSIAYLYMRDLGKNMDAAATWTSVQRMASRLKTRLIKQEKNQQHDEMEWLSTDGFFRWAQRHQITETAIWLMERLHQVAVHIPEGMDAGHAQRKLIKIIIGVVMHALEDMEEQIDPVVKAERLDEAFRLGYCYGITYPFIDDLLDAPSFSLEEKQLYSNMIRQTLLTGIVPQQQTWAGAHQTFILYVQEELQQAFLYIQQHLPPEKQQQFFEQAYVFFHAQEQDRAKSLSVQHYTNEALYYPVIIKSSSSRLIARAVVHSEEDEGFTARTFYYGIYNQLADDFADFMDDHKQGSVTPYTYYLTYKDKRADIINPFELYWTVIHYLTHVVYQQNEQVCTLILNRAINGLQRCRQRLGDSAYEQLMDTLTANNTVLKYWLNRLVKRVTNVNFLDKWFRDQYMEQFHRMKRVELAFREKMEQARAHINDTLPVTKSHGTGETQLLLADAANYSLESGGKRLRPLLTWVVGVEYYQLQTTDITPLLKSLEYMHTASLVFDDLPTQDNAEQRRGKKTLHILHNSAIAELTGLFLVQKAIQAQTSLRKANVFAAEDIVALIEYSAQKAEDLCIGQVMDLQAKGKQLTSEQLDEICYYKTGAAFEAAIVMPAILAKASEQEIATWKQFAYHAGIAFQIKDDLLDREGEAAVLGKPIGQDDHNNTSNYVSVFGVAGAKTAMWEHYSSAVEILKTLQQPTDFMQLILQYMIQRSK